MNRIVIAVTFAGAFSFSGLADAMTYYVAKNDPAAKDSNSGTETAPFATIQAAVDKASAGDVIRVKPGVYDQGGRYYSWTHDTTEQTSLDRVCIDKTLTLEATSKNPADTVIKGARDPNPPDGNAAGIGPNAVRCLRVIGDTVDVVVKGFTLADGAAHEWGTTDNAAGYPGGFSSDNMRCRAYFTDGVITNCSGARAGAIRYASAVRTLFIANTSRYGNDSGRAGKFFQCVFAKTGSAFKECRFVNCTIVETPTKSDALDADNMLFNSIGLLPGTFAAGKATAEKYRADHSLLPAVYNALADVGCSHVDDMPLVAPAAGDFRVRTASVTATLGDATLYPTALAAFEYNAKVPDAVEIYKSMDGVTINPASAAPIAAGAYQKTVETAGGAIAFATPLKVRGYVSQADNAYVFPTKAYEGLEAEPVGTTPVVYATRENRVGGTAFPDCDGVLRLGFPATGLVATNTAVFAANVFYVNPTGTDDEQSGRGLSDKKPYRTLQYAVDKLTGAGVVYAAEGTYQEGGRELYGVTNRLSGFSKSFRLVGQGVGKSFIYGHYDDETSTKSGDGRGAAALRCVALQGGYVAIQGFTLGEGYVRYNPENPTENAQAYIGGLVFSNCGTADWNHQFVNCALGGGVAYRGAIAYGANYVRCHFTGTTNLGGGLLRGARLANCLFTGSKLAGIADGCTVYASTLVEGVDATGKVPGITALVNSVIVGMNGSTGTYGDGVKGCVVWKAGTFGGSGVNTNVEKDPVFVDAADGDYRIGSTSPAVGPWYEGDAVADNLSPYDYSGKWRRPIAGKPSVGAFAEPVQEVVISSDATYSTFVVTGGTVGHNFVESGTTLTVSYAGGARRHPIGFKVDDEDVLSDPPTYTYSVPADGVAAAAAISVAPLYSTDWYVNCDASVGDDDNDGFTPETAVKTLSATANLALLAGDTVHVARGTYAEKDMTSVEGSDVPCRVSVPAGITFIGDEGAEKTIILGGDDIRPASVAGSGMLSGFTLTGGRLTTVYGGGFRGPYATLDRTDPTLWAIVRDCIVTNNAAPRGGAGHGGVAVNCRVFDNSGTASSGAYYQCRAYGTFIGPSAKNGSAQLCRYCYGFVNCTFADTTATPTADMPSGGLFDNCIVLSPGAKAITANNSIFVTGRYTGTVTDPSGTCQWIAEDAAAKLVDGVPAKDSPARDRGSNTLAQLSLLDGCDAFGGQRVYNGTIDVGAGEYDWRGDYKTDLQGAGFSVVAASPAVVETADKAFLLPTSGELALGNWALQPAGRNRLCLTAEVTGSGLLALLTNGVVCAEILKADGKKSLKVKGFPMSVSDKAEFVYYADGQESAGLGARICSVTAAPPGMCVIVR